MASVMCWGFGWHDTLQSLLRGWLCLSLFSSFFVCLFYPFHKFENRKPNCLLCHLKLLSKSHHWLFKVHTPNSIQLLKKINCLNDTWPLAVFLFATDYNWLRDLVPSGKERILPHSRRCWSQVAVISMQGNQDCMWLHLLYQNGSSYLVINALDRWERNCWRQS